MGPQDASSSRKTFVVDTSILVAAPDSVSHLTPENVVVIPFPVLQELDRRRTAANGVGYTARNTIRLIDRIQTQATQEQLKTGIPYNGGVLQFHDG
jgi:predicted ribonuclease YlaK